MITRQRLGRGVNIYVSESHTFGTDAILLADFAAPKKKDRAVDLGTGCGIIPMLWCRDGLTSSVTGVELQEEACMLAERSAVENGFDEKFSIINSDMLQLKGKTEFGCNNLITCNPPYKADGAGIKNADRQKVIARHEITCGLGDIISVAGRLLQSSGRLCMCNRPERLVDMTFFMRANGIEPKRLRLVCQRVGDEPWLVLLEGRKGGNRGMRIMPPLFVEDGNGLSAEMNEIYGCYKEDL